MKSSTPLDTFVQLQSDNSLEVLKDLNKKEVKDAKTGGDKKDDKKSKAKEVPNKEMQNGDVAPLSNDNPSYPTEFAICNGLNHPCHEVNDWMNNHSNDRSTNTKAE